MIRPAIAQDGDGVSAVWDASARVGFAELLPADHAFPVTDRERFLALLGDPGVRIVVADEGGELLGHTGFGANRAADPEPGVGEVRSLFVHPSAWRRGVGRALTAAALAGLAELGYSQATLWSFADNVRANAFYEREGFTRDGATRTEEVWALIPEVRYRRTLS